MSGHIIDMVNRIKQNKIQKRRKFKGDNRAMMHDGKLRKVTEYSFPELSDIKLELLKSEIREKARDANQYSFYTLIVFIVAVGLVFTALFTYLL